MTSEQLKKFEEAVEAGCSDAEGCAFAGIGSHELNDYQHENPHFLAEKEQLRLRPKAMAKVAMVKKVKRASIDDSPSPESDSKAAQWLLERTDPAYRPKTASDVTSGDKPLPTLIQVIAPSEIIQLQNE